ncbi:hypothetical protein ACIGMX_16225 [Streptomyces aquilus]|uniref:hypothetical protein n=1 Tax=Streptomyces aquilus TaxID=2548456 RepID=UPI0037D474A0
MIRLKGRERRAAERRHRQGMDAARQIVGRGILDEATDRIVPAAVVALVFGRTGERISADDARDFLNAALADRGFPLLPPTTEAAEAGEDQ